MYNKTLESILEIREWLLDTKFLPDRLHPNVIKVFLSSANGDKNKTKYLITNYFFIRQCIPEIFTKRSSILGENSSSWHGSCFLPLKKTKNGVRVFLGAVLDSNLYDFHIFVKQMYMCYDLLIMANDWDSETRVLVFSYHNMRVQNTAQFNVYLIKMAMELQTKRYLPGSLKAIHNVQVQPFMKKYIHDFKVILRKEKCNVLIHKSLVHLYNYVNPEILPQELGGRAGTLESLANRWFQKLRLHRSFFKKEEMKRMQEAKVCTF